MDTENIENGVNLEKIIPDTLNKALHKTVCDSEQNLSNVVAFKIDKTGKIISKEIIQKSNNKK